MSNNSTTVYQGNGWFTYNGQSNNYGYGYATSNNAVTATYTTTAAGSSSKYIFGIGNDGTNAHYYLNYVAQSTTYAMQTTSNYINFRNGSGSSGGGCNVFVQWVRSRAYPPSGTAPTNAFGSIIHTVQILDSIKFRYGLQLSDYIKFRYGLQINPNIEFRYGLQLSDYIKFRYGLQTSADNIKFRYGL